MKNQTLQKKNFILKRCSKQNAAYFPQNVDPPVDLSKTSLLS